MNFTADALIATYFYLIIPSRKLGRMSCQTYPVNLTMTTDTADWDHYELSQNAEAPSDDLVQLVDGSSQSLSGLSLEQLTEMQWEQETAFAQAIKSTTKGSQERTETIQIAYQTVCSILAQMSQLQGDSDFAMGMDRRYTRFVLDELAQMQRQGITGGLFEVGFGSGLLLEAAATEGYRVGGLEVAESLWSQAKDKLPNGSGNNLLLGNFVDHPKLDSLSESFAMVYWNDVFEHIPEDEIDDYLAKIYTLLAPGGQLVTITPNWHMRPVDVTANFLPPRSTAIGFHLKEYTLGEICQHLRTAGFENIRTPWFVGRQKIHCSSETLSTQIKCFVEPMLEVLPYRFAVQCCRRFGLTCSIARKPLETQ